MTGVVKDRCMNSLDFLLMLMGALIGVVLHSLIPFLSMLYHKINMFFIKVKKNDMFATYPYKVIEPWLIEDYNQLYEVTHVGKEYVKLMLIDRKKGFSDTERVITKSDLTSNYHKYMGKRSTKNKIKQRLGV